MGRLATLLFTMVAHRGLYTSGYIRMDLPNSKRAFVDLDKIRDYLLSPTHPRGKHKACAFVSALGIVYNDSEFLKEQLLMAARHYDAELGDVDEYGVRYILDFGCVHNVRRALIRSGWIVRQGERFPRLTTCYVIREVRCNG